MIEERHRKFLVDTVHADAVKHSGRSLLTHLTGTHDLLEKWGANQDVCLAGLFHSIYGTRQFRYQSWPLDRRAKIMALIGPRAERLAYLFCVIDRPRVLFNGEAYKHLLDDSSTYVRDTHQEVDVLLSAAVLNDLREIEAANLLEQGSKGKWLQLLLTENISAGARDAILLLNRLAKDGTGSE